MKTVIGYPVSRKELTEILSNNARDITFSCRVCGKVRSVSYLDSSEHDALVDENRSKIVTTFMDELTKKKSLVLFETASCYPDSDDDEDTMTFEEAVESVQVVCDPGNSDRFFIGFANDFEVHDDFSSVYQNLKYHQVIKMAKFPRYLGLDVRDLGVFAVDWTPSDGSLKFVIGKSPFYGVFLKHKDVEACYRSIGVFKDLDYDTEVSDYDLKYFSINGYLDVSACLEDLEIHVSVKDMKVPISIKKTEDEGLEFEVSFPANVKGFSLFTKNPDECASDLVSACDRYVSAAPDSLGSAPCLARAELETLAVAVLMARMNPESRRFVLGDAEIWF